ncbi:MAG TPA: AsmA family protein [Pseudolabrys sp.]|uniref:AsmA family protein n=1 Tax=Pseudolabrys sp. TaxID=1960880 RepID=UPI002DDD3862|nr:AsmA family protein [Pseudolabrys sp.]HEV2629470.1 AsmA family protein [Pseudolabrys sp.]
MTPAAGLKRLGFALLAVVVAGGGLLAARGVLVSSDSVREQALDEIQAVTGLRPVLRGPVEVSLFPNGTVSFDDVALGDAKTPALTAERLVARLRFLPLLIGHVEIADVSLERPQIAIDLEPNGGSNWAGLITSLAKSQKPGAPRPTAFSEMRINDGTVTLRDPQSGASERLDGVNFSLAWPSISKTFGATGRFVWHDEPIDASMTLADFSAALAGNRTGLKLRLSGKPGKLAFEGAIGVKPTLKLDGTIAADSKSLRDVMAWAGQTPLPGGGFGHFSIKAQTNVVGDTIGLSGVNVDLDGNTAEGVLTYVVDGRSSLQGTLASDKLDLTPYVSTARLLTANEHQWNNTRIALDGLTGSDFDLRISAGKVIVSNATFGRTAIGVTLRNGQLVVNVGEAQAYGGVIKGSMRLADAKGGIDVKSQLNFNDVDLESCLDQLFGLRRLEGKGDIALSLEGKGDTVLGVTRTLNGTASLKGQNGALAGLNIEQLLRRLERRPLSGGGEFRTGRTPFDKIAIDLKIVNGLAGVQTMAISGTAVNLALAGSASIPQRELDLKGTAALVAASRPGASPFSLPFIVQGSWDDPIMLPDPEALLRRSDAAAPLLDAIRDQRAREKIRSTIERLTGAPRADATPAADQPAPANKGE